MFFSKSAFLFRFLIFFRLRLPPAQRLSAAAIAADFIARRFARSASVKMLAQIMFVLRRRGPSQDAHAPGRVRRAGAYRSDFSGSARPICLCLGRSNAAAAATRGARRRRNAVGQFNDKIKPRRPKPTIQRPRRGACSQPRRREHRRARRAYCPAAAGAIARQACRICPGKQAGREGVLRLPSGRRKSRSPRINRKPPSANIGRKLRKHARLPPPMHI